VRVSFSITTNREDVRRLYEPLCAPFETRLEVVRALRGAGIETYATLAPLLPCDPEELARAALEASGRELIGDPLHVRSSKPLGATTREAAFKISGKHGYMEWVDPRFQESVTERIRRVARQAEQDFTTGVEGFAILARLPQLLFQQGFDNSAGVFVAVLKEVVVTRVLVSDLALLVDEEEGRDHQMVGGAGVG